MKVHFIAIGGSVMHNLAIALKKKGAFVSGSDDEIFEPARGRLQSAGILPEKTGWFTEKISNSLDAVILGMHAREDNPELLSAEKSGIPVYSFPEYLYRESRDKMRVVIGGSHGKTTITSMVMHVLNRCGKDFDYAVGAQVSGFDEMVRLSDAPVIIIEGDEYLSSPRDPRPKFHHYRPHLALLTGIAWDHVNVFPTIESYVNAFRDFARLIEKGGKLLYFEEDPLLKEIASLAPSAASYNAPRYETGDDGSVSLMIGREKARAGIFGSHNMQNIGGAMQLCFGLGISPSQFAGAIGSFTGAARRLELAGQSGNTWFYKDFAHAPSKLKATIRAARERHPGQKLVACVELHTFSSLSKSFLPQYRSSMDLADKAIVYFNPHTLQMKRLPPVSREEVAEAFGTPGLLVMNSSAELANELRATPWDNSVLLMMSSGNFDGIDFGEIGTFVLHTR